MPRRIADDEDMPRRRRRSAGAIAAEAGAERGLVLRMLLHSPKDMVAGTLAFAAIVAIVANALVHPPAQRPRALRSRAGCAQATPSSGL